jgi:hypothetical protein
MKYFNFFAICNAPTIISTTQFIMRLERMDGLLRIYKTKELAFNVYWEELLKKFPNP